jgi:6-phosphofructokinase 2
MSIVTYTPNPAIDAWSACDVVVPTEKTRVGDVRYDPGGGAINVARVLRALGTPVEAVYLAGGITGPVFDGLLLREGMQGVRIPIAGDTRISQVVLERSTGREFRFVAEGPVVTAREAGAALEVLSSAPCDWIVASGSLPRGLGDDHYAKVAAVAQGRGVKFALDTSGRALLAAVEAGGVDLLKASRKELASLVGRDLKTPHAVAEAAGALVARGIGCVLVSLGPDGAVLASADGLVEVPAPAVKVLGTVGAGDSFLGGFLHGTANGLHASEALRLAVAAGTAACLHPGTQLALVHDVRAILGPCEALAVLPAEP